MCIEHSEHIMNVVNTAHFPSFMDERRARELYLYLKKNIQWEDGIKGRKGFTRKAKPLSMDSGSANYDEKVAEIVLEAIHNICTRDYVILGVYLNYYQNGEMYTPAHRHVGQHQVVISLGATRELLVGSKSFQMKNGDVILFGSGLHSVPKDASVTRGRISIATFMLPI